MSCAAVTFCLLVIIEQSRAWVGGSLGCARQPGATVRGVELETNKNNKKKSAKQAPNKPWKVHLVPSEGGGGRGEGGGGGGGRRERVEYSHLFRIGMCCEGH